MKKLICILAGAAILAACEQKTTTVNPPAEKKNETTIVNPPGEKKTESNTTIIQPGDRKSQSTTTTTTTSTPNP